MRARRYGALVLVLVLVATGALSVVGTVRGWLLPSAAAPVAPAAVADTVFTAVAAPFAVDYLSWSTTDLPARRAALARGAATQSALDGWTGTGMQIADSPVVLRVSRQGEHRAVVTVRLRVTPYTPARPGPAPAAATGSSGMPANVASGPGAAAGTPARPRWLNIAVAVVERNGQASIAAMPALVGSPPTDAAEPAGGSNSMDTTYAEQTRDTVTTLMRSYGSGDLEFVRAAGTTFAGLDRAAVLDEVTQWQVAAVAPGGDPGTRFGLVTVIWELPDKTGKLRSSYRVELRNDNDRWYLLSVTTETEEEAG